MQQCCRYTPRRCYGWNSCFFLFYTVLLLGEARSPHCRFENPHFYLYPSQTTKKVGLGGGTKPTAGAIEWVKRSDIPYSDSEGTEALIKFFLKKLFREVFEGFGELFTKKFPKRSPHPHHSGPSGRPVPTLAFRKSAFFPLPKAKLS